MHLWPDVHELEDSQSLEGGVNSRYFCGPSEMLGRQYPRCYRHVLVIRPCYVMVMMHGGHEPSGPHEAQT